MVITFVVLLTLTLAVSGVTAQGLGGPGLDAPTHICSLILADVSPDGSSAGQVPRLSCQGPAGEGRLQVAGGALWTQPGAADGGVVVSPLGRSETDSARLAFTCGGSVTHLRLQHSVLSGIQLSAKGPLLQLLNCSRVSFDNVTLSGLGAPGQGVKYGAVQVSGAAVVSLAHFSCSNVTGFTVWGCLLLEVAAVADAQPAVYITDSSFTDVSTVGSASSTCKVFGAVVLDAAASTQQLPAAGLGVSMRRSIFERNAGGCGGALAVKCNLGQLQLDDQTQLLANTAQRSGGAIFLSAPAGALLVSGGSLLSNNSAKKGGVICAAAGLGSMVVDNSTVVGNTAESGGAVYGTGADLGDLTVRNGSIIRGNQATAENGGVVRCDKCNIGSFVVSGGSSAEYNAAAGEGGVVECDGLGRVEVADGSSVSHNVANSNGNGDSGGGAVRCNNLGVLRVSSGSQMDNNTVPVSPKARGGAVFAQKVVGLVVEVSDGSSLSHNGAGGSAGLRGGALYIGGTVSNVTVTGNSKADDNYAGEQGGCIMADNVGTIRIAANSSISSNRATAKYGGAFFVYKTVGAVELVDGSSADGNQAGTDGGFMWAESRLAVLSISSGSSMSGNQAGSSGGAVRVESVGQLLITGNSHADGNAVAARDKVTGGFVRADSSIDRFVLANSSSMDYNVGGAVHSAFLGEVQVLAGSSMSHNRALRGAAFQSHRQTGPVLIHQSRCNNNTAEVILKSDGSTDAGEGGCAYLYSAANVTIYGSEVVSNSGDTGGAIYAVGGFNSFTVDGGSNISNNSGLRYGGAICVLQPSKDGVLEFRGGSMIAGNTAGGTSVGGVLFVNQDVDRVTVRGANIVNNTGYEGGAFALNDLNTLEVVGNSTVYGNQATGGSGGFAKISDVYGTLRIGDGSTLAGNFASKSGGCVSAMTLANLEVTGGSVLANNAAGSGGMLSVEWVGSITIAGGSAVRSNVARGDGGGAVAIRESSGSSVCTLLPRHVSIAITDNATVAGNRAVGGDGGFIQYDAGITKRCDNLTVNATIPLTLLFNITSASLTSNRADGLGGALAVYQVPRLDDGSRFIFPRMLRVHIHDSRVAGNSAGAQGVKTAKITSLSSGLGGAVFMWAPLPADATMDSMQQASYPGDEGLAEGTGWPVGSSGCRLSVEDSTVESNTAGWSGGAAALVQCASRWRGVRMDGNEAVVSGGAVLVALAAEDDTDPAAGDMDGGLPAVFSNTTAAQTRRALAEGTGNTPGQPPSLWWVHIADSSLTNNTAGEGGALLMQPLLGSGSSSNSSSSPAATASLALALRNTTFASNTAKQGNGGALVVHGCSLLTVSGGHVSSNAAMQGQGGGLYADTCLGVLLDGVSFETNSAASGGAIALAGTSTNQTLLASATDPSMVLLYGVSFADNLAAAQDGRGGALLVRDGVAVGVSGCTFLQGNRALFGALVASTQRCTNVTDGDSQAAVPARLPPGATSSPWLPAWSALASAAQARCWPLAVAGNTTLPFPSVEGDHVFWDDLQVWTDDPELSAYHVNCTASTDGTLSSSAAALSVRDTVNNGVDQQRQQQRQQPNNGEFTYTRLSRALGQCLPDTPDVQERRATLTSGGGLLTVRPLSIRLVKLQQDDRAVAGNGASGTSGDSSSALQLSTGVPFDVAVQLYDVNGLAVTADVAAFQLFSLDLSLVPRDPSLSPSLAKLEGPVADRSLTKQLAGGRASWLQVQAQGWPGAYSLTFNVTIKNDLYQVAPLVVAVDLLPCRVGEVLTRASDMQPSWTSCRTCGKDQLSLWLDERPRLDSNASSSIELTQMDSTYRALVYGTGTSRGEGVATCAACPSLGQCAGGAVVVPQPGYWHSAANSTKIHRCPYPAACGGSAYRMQSDWGDLPPTPSNDTEFAAKLQDSRSRLLGICQHTWYESWPPGSAVSASYRANATPPEPRTAAAPCMLWQEPGFDVPQDAFGQYSYMQLQCAPGYTGTLCAACEPGHYLGVDYECRECLPLGGTIAVGLVFFFGGVVVVLLTTYANLREDYTGTPRSRDARRALAGRTLGPGPAELLKALILHIQYFIIIARINVDYPSAIVSCMAFFSSLSWAGSLFAASPACLRSDLDSAQQAWAEVLGSLLVPCLVVLVSLGLWAVRYRFYGASLLRRTKGLRHIPGKSRSLPSSLTSQLAAAEDTYGPPAQQPIELAAFQATPGTPAGATLHLGEDSNDAETTPRQRYEPPSNAGTPGGPRHRHVADVQTPRRAAAAAGGSGSPSPAAAPTHSPFGTASDTSSAVSPAEAMPYTPESGVQAKGPLLDRQLNSSFGTPFGHTYLSVSTPAYELNGLPVTAELQDPRSSDFAEPSLNNARPSATNSSSAATRLRQALSTHYTVVRHSLSTAVKRVRHANVHSALVHCDQSLSLLSQLGIVAMVAVFFLYPGWVQATLSIFSCYRVDDGEGSYPQHQQATWPHGYWVLNMNQECYAGEHRRAFLPIGILSLLVFCLAPPLASFLLLWHVRRQGLRRAAAEGQIRAPDPLQFDLHIKQVYGFLYRRFKPRYWWWESLLQVQVLVLVAAEVFGRVLPPAHHALTLVAVLLAIAFTNMVCAPLREHLLVLLEFSSLSVLSLTLTLGLYFTGDYPLQGVAADAITGVILAANAALLAAFLYLLLYPLWVRINASFRRSRGQLGFDVAAPAASSTGGPSAGRHTHAL